MSEPSGLFEAHAKLDDEAPERYPCPACKEQISVDAWACPFCTRNLHGPNKGEVTVADASARRGIAVIMFLMLIQIVLTIAVVAGLK